MAARDPDFRNRLNGGFRGPRDSVDARRQYEIAFRQAVDFMGVSGDFRTAPSQQNIGVVALFFGDRAREIDEIQRLLKIGETKDPVQMVVIDDLPFG